MNNLRVKFTRKSGVKLVLEKRAYLYKFTYSYMHSAFPVHLPPC